MNSVISKLMEELKANGKLTQLTDDEVKLITQHINTNMETFRHQFAKQQAQSIEDTAKIILNS